MSGMVVGSMIEADYRLREYEARMRMHKRRMRDRAMWESFENQYGKDDEDDIVAGTQDGNGRNTGTNN